MQEASQINSKKLLISALQMENVQQESKFSFWWKLKEKTL